MGLGVPGLPLRGYCGFPGDYWVLLGTTWTIGYYCGLLWIIGVTPGDTWGSWGLLGVSGWPLRGYCGFLGTTGCYLGLLWTIGYYCGLLWITGVTPGDTWGSWGLLGVPGWPLRGYCGFPGDYWVLLGITVGYWGLLWTAVDYWGDSWGHLGLLGIPGCSWLAPKRLLWVPW